MPKHSRQSRQAKSQRASYKANFDSGWTDDPFKKLLDPDYKPPENDEEDSGVEDTPFGITFSLLDGTDKETKEDVDDEGNSGGEEIDEGPVEDENPGKVIKWS
ncbi:hypothetical protein BDQ12DRAFT_669899 [Crucibulum laeve]|uniref:Uncharacterized protein n=1 Tax=Crucibulum laeve TaxID=68775 RepID=A0A5C3LL62_9AGAR|nr:hypothetical protein BDQ12DRAFT_669899 [Crucibulum laeve]